MRHSFSAEFLKILPPATNFGEAWELLCLHLLRVDTSDNTFFRLGPPDRGIDILRQSTGAAYQCKSSEQGIMGKIDPQPCIRSLQRAIEAKALLQWKDYSIALNAPLTGDGLAKINDFADKNITLSTHVNILAPEYWDSLCQKYKAIVEHMFDYRVHVSEAEVIEAFRKARYFDRFVDQAVRQIALSPLNVNVSNNRTEILLSIPFSAELTVEQLLDVVKSLLGVSLDRRMFSEFGTSCAPSLSMTVDRVAQPFKKKLSELTPDQLAKLQLFIQLIWREEKDKEDSPDKMYFNLQRQSPNWVPATSRDRGRLTLDRMETTIQAAMWQSITNRGPRQNSS